MAIPSRQIGWGTEDNLLWQISKQLERLTQVTGNAVATTSSTSTTAAPTTTTTTTLPVYRVYTALLTQNGTTAPVATVLENTIGVMSLEYSNPGTYSITSVEFNGFADYGKVAVLLTNGGSGYFTSAQYVPSINGITIRTVNNLNIATNDLMSGATIEIRLYN